MKTIITLIILVLILHSCKEKNSDSSDNEGYIQYEIQYPAEIMSQSISNILPQYMTVFYKGNQVKFKIKSDLNLFIMEFLSRSGGDSCYSLIKMVNHKIYYPLTKNERWFLFQNATPFTYKAHKDSISSIAGIKCYKVDIKYEDKKGTSAVAYFTSDINLNQNQLHTPFDKIGGIPIKFEISYNKQLFKFVAVKFSPVLDADESFTIPDDYELTNRHEIEDLLKMILN